MPRPKRSSDRPQSYDVIIAGGGPVGLTLAVALSRFAPGIRLALVDRRPLSVPGDSRASAIAAGVRNVFEAIGVWDAMAASANPIAAMHITDSGSGDIARPLFLRFDGPPEPGKPFAHMVPNTASLESLIGALDTALDIVAPAAVTGFDGSGPMASLTLEDGRVLSARLVVAADGGNSALRTLAGISTFGHDYGQSGIVTTIGHALPHNDVAYEHFRPAGPFASLPLKANRSSLVWTEKTDDAVRFKSMDNAALAAQIEKVMGSSLGAVEILDPVPVFPLALKIARSFTGPRLALIGDAAHVVHPIAGQGLNLGLKDVAALAEVIVSALRLGEDIGAPGVLERYQGLRRLDTTLMAMATDGLNRLFSNDVAPVRALRDFGLSLVDRMTPLKSAFIAQAAGASGPKLLRGLPI